ncbi:MAG TPA: hypothetical protein VGL40_02715 [Bacillota bacterium]|jgi:hypothetical protein
MNPIDAGILIVLLLGFILGAAKGLARLLVGALAFVASIAVAAAYHTQVAQLLDGQFHLVGKLAAFFSRRLALTPELLRLRAPSLAPEHVERLVGLLRLPEPFSTSLVTYLDRLAGTVAAGSGLASAARPETAAQALSLTVGTALVRGLAFLLILIIVALVFRLLTPLLAGAMTAVTGHGLSALAGGLIGLGLAGLGVAIILGLAVPFLGLAGYTPWIEALTTSRLSGWFLQVFMTIGPWSARP